MTTMMVMMMMMMMTRPTNLYRRTVRLNQRLAVLLRLF